MFSSFVNENLEAKIRTRRYFDFVLGNADFKAISFVNPFSYGILSEHAGLIESIDVFFSDGALLCACSNMRREDKIDRVSFDFSSIADAVFEYASEKGVSVALVGSAEDEIELAVEYLESRYPRMNIRYYRCGYFGESEFKSVTDELDLVNTGLLIAGMGTPLQEKFVAYVKRNSRSVAQSFTCGGFLTQTAVAGDYYSPFIKRTGLMWLQRCVKHKHVRRRLIRDYPIFIFSYIFNIKWFK